MALCGAAVEFKMGIFQDYENILPQAFADMVRVSNDLLLSGLKTGKIIDTVTVYGLLVAHNKHVAVPLKYYVDFTTNAHKIEVGAREFFGKLLSVVVFIGLLGEHPGSD